LNCKAQKNCAHRLFKVKKLCRLTSRLAFFQIQMVRKTFGIFVNHHTLPSCTQESPVFTIGIPAQTTAMPVFAPFSQGFPRI
jgi:hypothetical protein